MGVFKDLIKSLIRQAIVAFLAWLVTKGWVTQADADSWLDPMTTTILAGVVFVGIYLWSARDKFKSWLFGRLALEADPATPPQVIKKRVKRIMPKVVPSKRAVEKVLEADAPPVDDKGV